MIETAEKKQVIKAIGELKHKVTVADVATKTGLPILKVSQTLNQVASETGGHLQVSESGDIAYKFPAGFTNRYLTKGIQRVLKQVLQTSGKVLLYLFKISFGIMLILSLMIVVLAIFVIMFSGKSQSRDRDDGGGFDFHFGFFDYLILRDIFYFTTQSTINAAYDYNRPTIKRQNKSNFLLNCFSFLFGDGNPNEGLDEKRWQLIANVIKKHGNVMTAEQLAPYTGANPKNEDAVLPVLVRFNGQPEVTKSGNIIYTFPDFVPTTGTIQTETPPPFLREFPWRFTQVDQSSLLPVYIVAALNFFGSWYIWSYLCQHTLTGHIPALFNWLVVYGTLFVVIPACRFFMIQGFNQKIEQRNEQRAHYSELLIDPTPELKTKLTESRNYTTKEKQISDQDVVFTTEEDSRDQEDELDRKFKKLENNTFDASP